MTPAQKAMKEKHTRQNEAMSKAEQALAAQITRRPPK